ncbi:hypothetical protein DOTSEDRAFT_56068 [Dothistroma septosporum NZE10]|uniref:Uncharacterized protein n=1 Tax=Dothistroma septosporum (strain NZE10 / CBS 128990) TaxID=675120 RepID=N1PEF9_DOTSN|nr:hypothetical protein DOTSEDRAFT_56068 [Dothistroma septosporum NZE10]
MSQPSSSLWQRVINEYKSKLTQDELDVISRTSDPATLVVSLQASGSVAQHSSRIQRVQSSIDKYGTILAVFGSAVPEASGLLWGSLGLLHKTSGSSRELHKLITSMIEDVCNSAPEFETYEKVLGQMRIVDSALLDLYTCILEFFLRANEYIKRSSGKMRHLGALPDPYELQELLKKALKLKESIQKAVSAANMAMHYKWHEEIKDIFSQITIQPKGTLPCHMIPYPHNPAFYGRADILRELTREIEPIQGGRKSFALHGMGGVGKTQIVLNYVYSCVRKYPIIFWINADSRVKLAQSFVDAAKRLGIEPEDSIRDSDTITQYLNKWLTETSENWLMVFDNADNLEELKQFWPAGQNGCIIVTSRNPMSATFAGRGTLVRNLPAEEGEQLFLSLLTNGGYQHSFERSKEVVKQLGCLPLAINQVALFLIEQDCPVEEFFDIYADSAHSTNTFVDLDPATPNLFYEHTLATTWAISIKRLQANTTSLLAILSCLDPDIIPEELLRKGSKQHSHLAFLDKPLTYRNAVGELLRNGLVSSLASQGPISVSATTTNLPLHGLPQSTSSSTSHASTTPSTSNAGKGVSVHRLVREAVFHQLDTTSQVSTFSAAVDLCLAMYPHPTRTNFRMMHAWSDCQKYLPHLIALNARAEKNDSLLGSPALAELFLYGGFYLYERRRPEDGIPLLMTAAKVCDAMTSGIDWFIRARIAECFGSLRFECSKFQESEADYRTALQIRLDALGHDSDDILLAHGYNGPALPITAQGRYSEALDLQQQALDIISKCTDDFTKRDMTFHLYHNMGRTLEAAGRPEEALRLHFHFGDEFGNGLRQPDSESGAVNQYAVGNCFLALAASKNTPGSSGGSDEYSKGVEYHTKALRTRRALVGEQGFYYGISLHKMGCIFQMDGSLNEAADAFLKASEIFSGALDAQRELARSFYRLSLVKRLLGNDLEADAILAEAWKIRTEATGEDATTAGSRMEDFDALVIYIHA